MSTHEKHAHPCPVCGGDLLYVGRWLFDAGGEGRAFICPEGHLYVTGGPPSSPNPPPSSARGAS